MIQSGTIEPEMVLTAANAATRSYMCAAALAVVCMYNGLKPEGEALGFKLGPREVAPERMKVSEDIFESAESRAEHLQLLKFYLQEDISWEIGEALYELATKHRWAASEGLTRANELVAKAYDVGDLGLGILVEKRIIAKAVEALSIDPLASPFELKWTNHIGILYQIELLNNNSAEGRDLLLAEYDEAARIIIENWAIVAQLAAALRAPQGDDSDVVKEVAGSLFGQRFANTSTR